MFEAVGLLEPPRSLDPGQLGLMETYLFAH